MIKVMLVDDQNLVRKGVRSLLELSEEIEVVAEAADGDARRALNLLEISADLASGDRIEDAEQRVRMAVAVAGDQFGEIEIVTGVHADAFGQACAHRRRRERHSGW